MNANKNMPFCNKNIVLIMSLLFTTISMLHAQNNIITLTDTIHYRNDSIHVIESQINTSNSYKGNIFFHMAQQQSNTGNTNERVIPNGCNIPVDNACHGCDFEDKDLITTEYWGASVESFTWDWNAQDGYYILLTQDDCAGQSYPIDPDNQCLCTNTNAVDGFYLKVQTPVYYCPNNTNDFLNVNYSACDASLNPIDPSINTIENHFKLADYDELYTTIGLTNNCSGLASHFGSHVLRLGDDLRLSRISTIIKRIVVTPQMKSIKFDFALLMENPNHIEIANPAFSVRLMSNQLVDITRNNSNISRVDLGWGENEIYSTHPNLKKIDYQNTYYDYRYLENPRYIDWSCGLVNLNDFNVGDTVYILFEQRDCAKNGHKSYVYIDNITNGFCSNISTDASVSFNANTSYTCDNNIHLCFDYQLPRSVYHNELGQAYTGTIQIFLTSYQNGTQIRVDTSIIISNNGSGQYCFDLPTDIFSNINQGTFTYSLTSQLQCFNLIPINYSIPISIPKDSCIDTTCFENPQCDSLNIAAEEIVSIKQPCLDVDSGRIIINYTNLVNNYFSPNCAENLTYTIQKDDLYNHHWDEQCISEPSIVHTITNDTIFDALSYGDYIVQVKCTPVVNDTCLGTNLMPLGNFEDTSYWFGHNMYEDIHPNEVFYDGNIYTNNGYNQSNIWPGQMLFIKNQHYFNVGNAVDTCVDHSTGNGYMLGIQGMKGGGGEIFTDSVSIQNCTKYQFKFYYKKLGNGGGGYNSIRSPRLIVLINNQFVPLEKEILHDDISQNYWHEMIYTWYSGNQTQAVVTIKDFNRFNTPYYVLDDLSFRDIKQCGLPVDCPVKTFVSLDPKHFNIVDDLYFICPKDTLPIFIDSSLFTRVNSWSYCCQEHSGELDPSKKTDITPDNFSHYYTGGTFGGYFYVEAQTYQGCHASDTGFIVDFNSPGLELKEIDSVLNVSASKFRSIWKPIYSSVQWSSADDLMSFKNKLPFNSGMFGMYRPRQVFDYIDNRIQSKNNLYETDVKLKMDGTFNDFKMFNWYHSRFAECAPEWKLNHTITNYNPGSFEIENKDILNVYSTALYGYGGKLETAVAANADYEEIGYENFEEYSSSDFNTINQLNNTTGNLDVVPKILELKYPYMLEYDIEAAFGRYALVKNIEGNLCCDIPLNVFFQGRTLETNLGPKSSKSQEVSMKATVLVSNTNCNDKDPDLKLVTFQTTDKSRPYPFANGQYCDRFWTGTLLVEKEIPVKEQTFTKISLSSTKAHSGKNSILIDTGFTSIPQYDLHLKAGKNYVVSAWIHVDDSYTNLSPEQLETFNNNNRIGVSLKVGNLSTMLYPSGEVIEGWQRLEGVVHVVDKDKIPSLEFMNTKKLYLDDIRIYPENGSIQTYVYDPSNYRLKAVLDQNNYATFYQYDDEGNLFSVKKETVKGIKTIQATQNYIKTK